MFRIRIDTKIRAMPAAETGVSCSPNRAIPQIVAVSGSTKAMTEALPASIIVSPFVYSSDGMSVQTSASGTIIQIRDGSCAILPGADEAIASRTQVNTIIANPFANMMLSDRIRANNLLADASSLMTACGLALRRFDE